MVFPRLALLALLLLSCTSQAEMPRIELGAGVHRIVAEVAHTDAMREQGLMRRTALGAHDGMLFVFTQPYQHCMWMRNTLIPLSVAFLDDQGRIINVEDMQPQTEDNHCAARPARYALEMNRGWFATRGLKPGARIAGIERAPAPR